MSARTLSALAVADFRERTRRPAYVVTLAGAVALAYLALPPASSLYVILDAGGYRGVYDSAYAWTATALAGALWLMLGGFYVVRGTVARDRDTGVGQILAATPLRTVGYLTGKFWSNLMVLASMAGVLAVAALALQLARGEVTAVDPVALLLPYLLITLPVLAFTSAAALVTDTIRGLRGGLGNIAWFFAWMILAVAGQGTVLGMGTVSEAMRETMAAHGLSDAAEFSLGFTQVDRPLSTFAWSGLEPSAGFVAGRLAVILVAACGAALPAIWFGRFDPARLQRETSTAAGDSEHGAPAAPVTAAARPARRVAYRPLPQGRVGRRHAFGRLLAGEARILVQGVSYWWWLVVAAINVAAVAVPASAGGGVGVALLAATWIWPVLIWSRLGAQRRENGLETLIGAYPGVHRQLLAEWAAGVLLTAAVGIGSLIRMTIASDGPAVAAWCAGALFIPSLALLLGTVSRTHRMFQALYVMLWYGAVNQVAVVDYMGTALVDGRPAGAPASLVAGVALAMLAIAITVRAARHAAR